jgi:hypothetical protein
MEAVGRVMPVEKKLMTSSEIEPSAFRLVAL